MLNVEADQFHRLDRGKKIAQFRKAIVARPEQEIFDSCTTLHDRADPDGFDCGTLLCGQAIADQDVAKIDKGSEAKRVKRERKKLCVTVDLAACAEQREAARSEVLEECVGLAINFSVADFRERDASRLGEDVFEDLVAQLGRKTEERRAAAVADGANICESEYRKSR